MKSLSVNFCLILSVFSMLLAAPTEVAAQSQVAIEAKADGSFVLVRDGQPFFINGAGGVDHLEVLAHNGGN